MDSFKRKPVTAGIDYPTSGSLDEYGANSPERVVVEFIDYWKNSNYGKMSTITFHSDYYTKSQMAGRISKIFKNKQITQFNILNSDDLSSCKVDINTEISISYNSNFAQTYLITFRVLYCKKDSTELVVNTSRPGQWKVADNFLEIDQIGSMLEFL
jgi:hypothetical protein